jgi:hypothetical protein
VPRALAISCFAALSACGRIGYDVSAPVGQDAADAAATALGQGLIAYYRLDEPTGGIRFADSSGNRNDAYVEAISATDYVPGRIGGAIRFGQADWLWTEFSASFNEIKSGITIAAWIRIDALEPRDQVILQRQAGTGVGAQFVLRMRDGRPTLDAPATGACDGPALPVDHWVHLAATYDGRRQRLLFDGQEVRACATSGGFAPDGTGITVGMPRVGPRPLDVDKDRALRAYLDEVMVYARALTDAELGALAAGQLPPVR